MSSRTAPPSVGSEASPPVTAPPTKPRSRPFPIDARYIAPIFITVILLIAQMSYGVLESYRQTLIAIGSSILAEIVLSRLVYKKWPHLASAYVTGISVGILLRTPWTWPFALCSVLSIGSKYVLRVKGRHLWNPSNFGISMMLLLAPQAVATLGIQWGNSIWPMVIVWTLGAFIVWRLSRLHICAAYVASFIAFAALRAALPGHHPFGLDRAFNAELAPITGPMYQLYIFFMITDPKSTVLTRRGQIAVAVAVAAMECVLRLLDNVHAPYYALFLVGPAANGLEIWRNSRRVRVSPVASPVRPGPVSP